MTRKKSGLTLRAVAKAARVSLSTASNVVNGRFEKMSAETRESVEKAIAELHYRPAADARAMRMDKRMVAGILILDRSGAFLTDPYISQIVAGFSQVAWRHGFVCLIDGATPETVGASPLLRFAQTDGICVYQSGQVDERHLVLNRLAQIGEPVVAIEEPVLPEIGDIAAIRQDSLGAARDLAQRLRPQGVRRVLMLTPDWIWPAMESRIQGIRAEFGSDNLSILHCGDGSLDPAIEALRQWLAQMPGPLPVDGVIAGTDRLGFALDMVAQSEPRLARLALGGFHSFSQRHLPAPKLSLISLPASDLGEAAAEMLIERIETGSFSQRQQVAKRAASADALDLPREAGMA